MGALALGPSPWARAGLSWWTFRPLLRPWVDWLYGLWADRRLALTDREVCCSQ
ncbi:hypothetical protein [Synechocystis sp. LKSZ1]|uniref:hypothetical protein n=1 Tax=Synechocystis sp. LKSZ1 TaxID=3144951 RepID=UPI00336BF7BB